ncbi:unnamed protein product [Ceratitis capitata]|uniref:(Mediterranean fruit fly) hypothetical protein n=1 Tax=Ceratitis capitata TaxID=7213 RepID=A0A811URU3_CERCA|nr:unnamed protein product [Ceratitis capitata]
MKSGGAGFKEATDKAQPHQTARSAGSRAIRQRRPYGHKVSYGKASVRNRLRLDFKNRAPANKPRDKAQVLLSGSAIKQQGPNQRPNRAARPKTTAQQSSKAQTNGPTAARPKPTAQQKQQGQHQPTIS